MARSVLILAVGGKHDPELTAAIAKYETRLKSRFTFQWQTVPYSTQSGDTARRDESTRLLAKIKSSDYIVLLDERGIQTSSEGLAAKIESIPSHLRLVLVIGGAYGVDETMRERANYIWSLSKLVFPHQLVRLILVEQLYRAEMIRDNHPYHHQ